MDSIVGRLLKTAFSEDGRSGLKSDNKNFPGLERALKSFSVKNEANDHAD